MGLSGQCHAQAALPPEKRPCTHGTEGWACPRAVWTVRNMSPPPRFEPRTVQPVASRYTDCAIPVHKRSVQYCATVNITYYCWPSSVTTDGLQTTVCQSKKFNYVVQHRKYWIVCGQPCATLILLPSVCLTVNMYKKNISGLQNYFQGSNCVAWLIKADWEWLFLLHRDNILE